MPEDARFCHKCGKPQRDEPLLVEEESEVLEVPSTPPVPPAIPQLPPIGFHNRPAVNAALIAGVFGSLLSTITGGAGVPAPLAFLLGLFTAGFLAVFLYQRRTGQKLSVLHGAHLGWISGIFGFAIALVIVALQLSSPAIRAAMWEQLRTAAAGRQVQMDQLAEMMHSPSVMLTVVAFTFLLFTVCTAFGGALGAKLLDRRD